MTLHERFEKLDALLSGPEPAWDDDPEPPAGVDQANGMLRTLGTLRRRLTEDEDLYAAEIEKLGLWIRHQRDVMRARESWLETALALWHAGLLREDARRKTVQLPNGTLTARSQPPEWTYTDEASFLAWAAATAPELVRLPEPPKPAPDKAAAKKELRIPGKPVAGARVQPVTAAGEIVPGVLVTIRPPKFTATPET